MRGEGQGMEGMRVSEIDDREYNWRYAHSFPGAVCEHYIGGGDWGLDCKLQYWLCSGPSSDRCPLVSGKRECTW